MKKLTTDDFIKRSKLVHGSEYDYSKSIYKRQTQKVCIVCKIHGEFYQRPNDHINGQQCKKCSLIKSANKRRKNLSEFIKKAKKIHNGKYDYSQSIYTGIKNNIIIICKKHGKFYQRAENHLLGSGCKKCGVESSSKKMSHTTSHFLQKVRKVHGNKFDYSKTIYKNNNTKIKIICKIHGTFYQNPMNHLHKKRGCYKCGIVTISNKCRKSKNNFVNESKKIHDDKYDYSKFDYINAHKKSTIICKIHGEFSQSADNHLHGKGCPKCTKKISKAELEFLTFLNIPDIPECRQLRINRYKVDGYDINTNTVYEFLGDYWHGNPTVFKHNDINKSSKKTFGTLYDNTMYKFDCLKNIGYNIKYIWESDWKKFKNNIDSHPNILTF